MICNYAFIKDVKLDFTNEIVGTCNCMKKGEGIFIDDYDTLESATNKMCKDCEEGEYE